MAQINFGILNTDLPAQIGAMPANALAARRQRIQQDEDRAFAREGAQMQNALARMQMTKTQADMDEETAYKRELGGIQDGNYSAAMPKLMQASPARALALQKQLTEQQKALIEGRAKMTDLQGKKLEMYRGQLTEVRTPEQMAQWYVAQRQDPDLQGFAWPTTIEDTLSQLQQASATPRDFEQWKLKTALGMKAFMEMQKPDLKALNLGGVEQIVDMNAYSNPDAVGQTFQRTASPEALLSAETARRGQNMSDARQREATAVAREGNVTGKAPSGYRYKQDGTLEAIPGGPADKAAVATEGERKAATLLARLEGSLGQMQQVTSKNDGAASPEIIPSAVRAITFGQLEAPANTLTSSDRQRVEAAQLDILDAALTLGTGAAYTREQLEGYRKSYFPQIGDSPANVKDKQERLNNVISAARIAAGRAASAVPSRDSGTPTQPRNVTVDY